MGSHYDKDGVEISMLEWATKSEEPGYKRIDITQITPDVRVSTVWLGINHQFLEGPPLIFETMVFGGKHDDYQDRYSTKEGAIAGHARVVAALQKGETP